MNQIGKRYGKLLVTGLSDPSKNGRATYKCICDCGTVKIIGNGNLTKSKSCGCERWKPKKRINKVKNLNSLTLDEDKGRVWDSKTAGKHAYSGIGKTGYVAC